MSTNRSIKEITSYSPLNGVVPGVQGQRAFPTRNLRRIDPFVMLDHIGPQALDSNYKMEGTAHPHRGFETITFMFEGIMDHVDSIGNQVTLESGSAQMMTAGSGIMHGGDMRPDPESLVFHEVQLWVNMPAADKMIQPKIQNASAEEIPVIEKGNVKVRVIAGEMLGKTGPLSTTVPVTALHTVSQLGGNLTLPSIPKNDNALIYVLTGGAIMEGRSVDEYQTILLNNDGENISLELLENTQLLILSGTPINEPVAMGGPFVMNTQAEIEQAFADFQAGKFGSVPVTQ